MMTYKPSKLGQINPVCAQSSSVGLHMQDYKSLHTAVITCATMVGQKLTVFSSPQNDLTKWLKMSVCPYMSVFKLCEKHTLTTSNLIIGVYRIFCSSSIQFE